MSAPPPPWPRASAPMGRSLSVSVAQTGSPSPGRAAAGRTLDRRLASRGPRLLGRDGRAGRPAQPRLLDRLRAHRLLDLEHVVGLRAVPRPGVRLRPRAEVPAHDGPRRGRRRAADPLHVRRRPVRRAQLDRGQRRAAARAVPCGARRSLQPGRVVRRRCWWWPRWPASAAATSPRRWPTSTPSTRSACKGWALGLNAGGGNIGVAAVQLVGLAVLATAGADHPRVLIAVYIPLVVAGHAGRRAAHGQPRRHDAQRRSGRCATSCRERHTWVISLPLHRHVRLVHRLRVRLRPGAPGAVRRARSTRRSRPPTSRSSGRCSARWCGRSAGGWPTARRLAGHAVDVRGDGGRRRRRARRLAASGRCRCSSSASSRLFVLTGLGNGSTYKMIPAIFTAKAGTAVAGRRAMPTPPRRAARRLVPGADRHGRRRRRVRRACS